MFFCCCMYLSEWQFRTEFATLLHWAEWRLKYWVLLLPDQSMRMVTERAPVGAKKYWWLAGLKSPPTSLSRVRTHGPRGPLFSPPNIFTSQPRVREKNCQVRTRSCPYHSLSSSKNHLNYIFWGVPISSIVRYNCRTKHSLDPGRIQALLTNGIISLRKGYWKPYNEPCTMCNQFSM